MLNPADVIRIFGLVTLPNGMTVINSVMVNRLWARSLFIEGETHLDDTYVRRLFLEEALVLPNGSESAPSLSFASDTTTGFYRDGSGGIGFSVAGSNSLSLDSVAAFAVPISSPPGQDLVIDSSSGIVDFSNNTLINVAGISANPNYYIVYAPGTVTTTNAALTLLFNVPVTMNSAFLVSTDISVANSSDNLSTAAFTIVTKAKNIGGIVTFGATTTLVSSIDAGLIGITVAYGVAAMNLTVNVTGLAATTIKWFGAATVTRQLF